MTDSERFYGPIDDSLLTLEKEDQNDAITSLKSRKEECTQSRDVVAVNTEAESPYTKPVTVLVKGKWSGHPAVICVDPIVSVVEFDDDDQTFTLSHPDGRRHAAAVTGRALPPADPFAAMVSWPREKALFARNKGAEKYGADSTPCGNNFPSVVIWQYDARFNSDNPYKVLGVLNPR